MGRRPRELTPEASARDRFGAELRRWRLARGLTQRGLAGLIWHSQELVAKVEKAERWPSWSLATRCDAVLRTGGMLARLWPAVERQRLAGDRRAPAPAGRAGADNPAGGP
jgi:DNA-binding XRE family transcriptional regulator